MAKRWKAWMVLGVLLVGARSASAMLLVSIDLDPSTPGTQDALSVEAGNSFTATLVLSVSGSTPVPVDTVLLETVFNSAGPVLGLSGVDGTPVAGSLAAGAGVIDSYNFPFLLDPGTFPMATAPAPYAPTTGFDGQSGGHGMSLLGGRLLLGEYSFYSLTFDALTPGVSDVLPSAGAPSAFPGLPGPDGGILFFGTPVAFDTAGATVTVTDPGRQIPEPSMLALFGLGLLGLRRVAHRR